jgi:phospholipid transport system substrate-binding protein
MKVVAFIFTILLLFINTSFAQTCEDFANAFIKQATSATVSSQYRSYLSQSLDLQNATKFALGANWRTLTPDQRKKFHDIYSQYVVYKYASQMEKYKIMEYKIIATKNDDKRPNICNAEVLIKTTIQNKIAQVTLKSVISTKNANVPLFQDLILENISVLQLQRDEVESLLKSKGFDGMIKIFQKFVKDNK